MKKTTMGEPGAMGSPIDSRSKVASAPNPLYVPENENTWMHKPADDALVDSEGNGPVETTPHTTTSVGPGGDTRPAVGPGGDTRPAVGRTAPANTEDPEPKSEEDAPKKEGEGPV